MSVVYKKLEEVCEILDSQRVPITAKDRKSGIYPYYGANGLQDHVSDYIFDDELVLLAEDGGNFGSKDRPIAYRVSGKCWVNNHAHVLKAKSDIHIDYLCYALMFYNTDGLVNGATRQKLTQAAMRQMVIPCRCMKEQEQIVDEISRVFHLIAVRNEELALLEQLVKSRFIELFGDVIHNSKAWQMRLFADIASSRLGKMLDAKQQTGKCSYPYLANFNVQWFRFNIENLNQMDFDEDDRAEFELKDGDLLVCEGGEIGRCAVWHNEIQPCFFQKALHRVRCNRQIIQPDYLAWWFKYKCDHDGFAAIAGAKATIAHLPGVKLKQLQVAVPPIELQQQFAAFVEQTDKSKLAVQKALEELEILKKSLMQQYFG
jgi:type I restriction enzyme S subunit